MHINENEDSDMENKTYKFAVKGNARKKLVTTLQEQMRCPIKYLGAPTFSYELNNGEYHIDKEGTVTGPELSLNIMVALLEQGFEPEADPNFHLITPRGTLLCQRRYDTAAEAEADGYNIAFHHEGRDVYTKDSGKEYCPFFAVVGAPFEGAAEAPEPEAELADEPEAPEADEVVIEIPLEGFTPETIDNLCKMVAAKETLIKMALGVESLPIQVLDDRIAFPWFTATTDGEQINAYTQLVSALCRTALEKTRVTAQPKEDHPNPRFTMRCWLISLGLTGPEFKLIRKLMCAIPGNGAWSKGIDPRKAAQAEAAEEITETEIAGDALPGEEGAEND